MKKKLAFVLFFSIVAFAFGNANETQEGLTAYFTSKELNGSWCVGPIGDCHIPPS